MPRRAFGYATFQGKFEKSGEILYEYKNKQHNGLQIADCSNGTRTFNGSLMPKSALCLLTLGSIALYITVTLTFYQLAQKGQQDRILKDLVTSPSLFAVADLHGDLHQAQKALDKAGLTSGDKGWTGGDAIVVQLGDIFDRGPHSLDLFAYFEELKAEAIAAAGQVHTLLGNHELMNLEGNYHYVSRAELHALGNQRPGNDRQDSSRDSIREGLRLWKNLMTTEQDIGSTLRERPAVVLKGEGPCKTLFVHAGISEDLLTQLQSQELEQDFSVEELVAMLNSEVRGALGCVGGTCQMSPLQHKMLNAPDSLVWYRGYATMSEASLCSEVQAVLSKFGARQLVVGHNVVPGGRPRVRCKSSLYMMDVGMSAAYGGNKPAVWKCHKGKVEVLCAS